MLPESELASFQDLADAKFKGKVTTLDWRGGSASNNFALLLADPKYGAIIIPGGELVVINTVIDEVTDNAAHVQAVIAQGTRSAAA